MKEHVKALIELRDIDSELYFLQDLRVKRPQEMQREAETLQRAEEAVARVQDEIKRTKMDSDRGELDIKSFQAERDKLQIALNTAKTNAEYQVFKGQIEKIAEKTGVVEEQVLDKFGRLDELGRQKQLALEKVALVKREVAEKQKQLESFLAEVDGRLQSLGERRKTAAERIKKDTLEIYRRVLGRYKEGALAAVENGVCQGCHMAVTKQVQNQLLMQEDLVQCRNCMRILYMND